jgi:hypothetical protein
MLSGFVYIFGASRMAALSEEKRVRNQPARWSILLRNILEGSRIEVIFSQQPIEFSAMSP